MPTPATAATSPLRRCSAVLKRGVEKDATGGVRGDGAVGLDGGLDGEVGDGATLDGVVGDGALGLDGGLDCEVGDGATLDGVVGDVSCISKCSIRRTRFAVPTLAMAATSL